MRATGMIILTASVAALIGCEQVPHNDVMLFGTTTKVALDVSAPPENVGVPEITVGYKRKEFVWMPLLANAKHSKLATKVTGGKIGDAKYAGTTGSAASPAETDTYSVLASFGAEFAAGATTGEAQASGGLAQFFATGIAARRLAEVGGAKLVAIQPGHKIDEKIIKGAEKLGEKQVAAADRIAQHVDKDGKVDAAKRKGLATCSGLPETWLAEHDGKPVAGFRDDVAGTYYTFAPTIVKKCIDT